MPNGKTVKCFLLCLSLLISGLGPFEAQLYAKDKPKAALTVILQESDDGWRTAGLDKTYHALEQAEQHHARNAQEHRNQWGREEARPVRQGDTPSISQATVSSGPLQITSDPPSPSGSEAQAATPAAGAPRTAWLGIAPIMNQIRL